MDVNALYDREVAYYTNRPIVVYLPESNSELATDILITKLDNGVKTTITAPFTPAASSSVTSLKVINKPAGHPVSYSGRFTAADTATLTPAPQFSLNQVVLIGANNYKAIMITGTTVKFERAITDLLVYVAQAVSEEVTYQWQILIGDTWTNITGATERTYEPIPGDVGKDLRVIITYTDGRGEVGDTTPIPDTSFTINSDLMITPVYPLIAEITLDVQRKYAPNSINKFVIEVDSTS